MKENVIRDNDILMGKFKQKIIKFFDQLDMYLIFNYKIIFKKVSYIGMA